MKKLLIRMSLVLLGMLLLSQFIQPDRSAPAPEPAKDMLTMLNAPADIQQLVIGACYDCHSYRTEYPWYSKITPVNFILQSHINEGREVVNYSLWDQYAGREAAGESGETIQEGEMPPGYYSFMHAHGRLSAADKQKLVEWFNANMPGEGEGGNGNGAESENDEMEDE